MFETVFPYLSEENGCSSRLDDTVVQDERQLNDDVLHDERHQDDNVVLIRDNKRLIMISLM